MLPFACLFEMDFEQELCQKMAASFHGFRAIFFADLQSNAKEPRKDGKPHGHLPSKNFHARPRLQNRQAKGRTIAKAETLQLGLWGARRCPASPQRLVQADQIGDDLTFTLRQLILKRQQRSLGVQNALKVDESRRVLVAR